MDRLQELALLCWERSPAVEGERRRETQGWSRPPGDGLGAPAREAFLSDGLRRPGSLLAVGQGRSDGRQPRVAPT